MIKKISLGFALALALIGTAKADTLEKVVIQDVVGRRNVVVTNPQTDEKVFLHVKPGCGDLVVSQPVSLLITGDLNGNSDFLKIDSIHQCAIDQVEPFTQKLYVRQFTNGNSEILATDESGQDYLIGYGELCQAIPQFRESWIFVLQGNKTLAEGDRLYLPDNTGSCSIDRLEKQAVAKSTTPSKPSNTFDRQRPTSVSGLKAILGNKQIYLTWKAAQDDRGIAYYLISTSTSAIDTKDIGAAAMPNVVQEKSLRHTVTGLENGQRYYFYVAAVDTSGNQSSDWASALATPADIFVGTSITPRLNMRIEGQTTQFFYLRWDRIPNATRTTVYLDVDGKRAYSNTHYETRTLQVSKSADRRGKTLTVTVRTSGLNGLIREEKIDFKF